MEHDLFRKPVPAFRDHALERQSHRPCLVCMVSMLGRKAGLQSVGYDIFEWPLCGTVVSYVLAREPLMGVGPTGDFDG